MSHPTPAEIEAALFRAESPRAYLDEFVETSRYDAVVLATHVRTQSSELAEAKAARDYLSANCGKIIVAMDSGNLSLAKHLLVTAMAFPEPGEGGTR